jgi:thiamine biosynthesis protein ThiI
MFLCLSLLQAYVSLFIARYAEIGLKSERVRRRFEDILALNIEKHFMARHMECLVSWDRGRLFIMADDKTAMDVLSHTFGIVSFSRAMEVGKGKQEIIDAVVRVASTLLFSGCSFAIRARRSGNHEFTSMDIAREAGAAVLSQFNHLGISVNLDAPDVEIFVEARERASYIYTSIHEGPGGLPLGTQGTVLCPVDREQDMVAAWLIMRRGCRTVISTDIDVSVLRKWDPELKTVEKGDPYQLALKYGCEAVAFPDAELREKKEGIASLYPSAMLMPEELNELLETIRA